VTTIGRTTNLLASVCLLVLTVACSEAPDSEAPNPPISADSTTAEAGETLIAQPPAGWLQINATNTRNIRSAQFIPDDESDENWTRKITFESLLESPLPDPIEFIEILNTGQNSRCGTYEAFPTFTGFENGYETSVYLLICHNDRQAKQSEVTMIKAIKGNDFFYVITRTKTAPPVTEGAIAIEEEVVAAWSLYLRSITLCDSTREAHPCPDA